MVGNNALSLGEGVRGSIAGPALTGSPGNCLNKSYQIITAGTYSNIAARLAPSILTIGGTDYNVSLVNSLGTNGKVSIAALTPLPAPAVYDASDFDLPPQDAAGWSILRSSSDSRLVYVDPAGLDTSGTFYAPSDPLIGPDPQNPGAIKPYKTLAKAYDTVRANYPDWILLRSGSTWTDEQLKFKNGRSPSERAVVCAYGGGARPLLKTGTRKGVGSTSAANVAVVGIKFWAHTREGGTASAGSNGMHLTAGTGTTAKVQDVLIEDCVFRAYTTGIVLAGSGQDTQPFERFAMRRSQVLRSYQNTEAHSQGIFFANRGKPVVPTVFLEENTFDHNGWLIQGSGSNNPANGMGTMFNHNVYCAEAKGVVLTGNHFLRASSMGTKFTSYSEGASESVRISNNLYSEGEIGIIADFNETGPLRCADYVFENNVLTDIGRTMPAGRPIAWYVDAQDWGTGAIVNNLLINQKTDIGNCFGIRVTSHEAAGFVSDVVLHGNVLANLNGGGNTASALVRLEEGQLASGVLCQGNTAHSDTSTPAISYTAGGYAFGAGNRYSTGAPANQHFVLSGTFADLAGWKTATGDNDATTVAPDFPDPTRCIESYVDYLQLTGTDTKVDKFIKALEGQSKANWNPALTAPAVNDWLRAGFGLSPVP